MDIDIEIKPYGDRAFLIQIGRGIDEATAAKVSQFYRSLSSAKIDHVEALIPAYDSITVLFDPRNSEPEILLQQIKDTIGQVQDQASSLQRTLIVPVCYDDEFGIDLALLGEELSLTKEEIITSHFGQLYRVYMIGFLPGFPYMGRTADKLYCRRLDNPRRRVERGSVAMAGYQTGIYPSTAPGGWKIIGRTPVPMFDVASSSPSTLVAGNAVQFRMVDREEYEHIGSAIKHGKYQLEWHE